MYVTYDEFKTQSAFEIDEALFNRLCKRASREIDALTFNRIVGIGFDRLSSFQREILKESVIYQIEFIHAMGETLDSPITSYSAGGTSVSFDRTAFTIVNKIKTCDVVMSHLKQTGLTVRSWL